MAIVFDAFAFGSVGAASSLTYSHTTTTSADRVMYLDLGNRVDIYNAGQPDVDYNTDVATQIGNDISGTVTCRIFRLIAPDTGTNTVTVTWSSNARGVVASRTYSGVDQTTPNGTVGSGTGTDAAPTATIASGGTDELVADAACVRSNQTTLAPDASQTSRYRENSGGGGAHVTLGGSEEAGVSGNVTMSWTMAAANDWVVCGYSIKPVSAAVGSEFDITGVATTDFDSSKKIEASYSIAGAATTDFDALVTIQATYAIAGVAVTDFRALVGSTFDIAGVATSTFVGQSTAEAAYAIPGVATVSMIATPNWKPEEPSTDVWTVQTPSSDDWEVQSPSVDPWTIQSD